MKKYTLKLNLDDFDPEHTLECGQFFRYKKDIDNNYWVFSDDKRAKIVKNGDKIFVESYQKDFFYSFFDLDTNYSELNNKLKKFSFMIKPVEFAHGLRILRQPLFETIVAFLISQNNNISRIKKIIENICLNYGSKKVDGFGEYYAFPTQKQLLGLNTDDFLKLGLGYRAQYLVSDIPKLTDDFLNKIKELNTEDARVELMKLKGVGRKVADCILLFGLNKKNVFPVDVWINKMFISFFPEQIKLNPKLENNRQKISDYLVAQFGDLSGLCQQYLFFFMRQKDGG